MGYAPYTTGLIQGLYLGYRRPDAATGGISPENAAMIALAVAADSVDLFSCRDWGKIKNQNPAFRRVVCSGCPRGPRILGSGPDTSGYDELVGLRWSQEAEQLFTSE